MIACLTSCVRRSCLSFLFSLLSARRARREPSNAHQQSRAASARDRRVTEAIVLARAGIKAEFLKYMTEEQLVAALTTDANALVRVCFLFLSFECFTKVSFLTVP